jgi:hydroxymethylpyrimidine/phosphomethylpyrimidine kinase
VAEALGQYTLPVILDPVIVSSTGHRLLSLEAQDVVKKRLLPLSTLVTPNIPEMEALSNLPVTTIEQKEQAAKSLFDCGARAILLKGGHEDGETKSDILFIKTQSGIESTIFSSETISTRNTHGTGCTLSSAIAAFMARGYSMHEAIAEAKRYISEAIRSGADVEIGHGIGPVNHGFNPLKLVINEDPKL